MRYFRVGENSAYAKKLDYGILGTAAQLAMSRISKPSQRHQENEELLQEIEQIHKDSLSTYGSPRIYQDLKARGRTLGRGRVARLMRANGIHAVQKRRSRRTTRLKPPVPHG